MAKGWRGSDDDGRSAGGYHEHGTGLTDGLVVDVDAYDSVGTEGGSALHHLVDGGAAAGAAGAKKDLAQMSWDEIDKAERLAELKNEHPDLYAAKYREKFGA